MKTHAHKRGFTLAETMVVVAIIGVMMTMVAVKVIGRAPHYQMEDLRWKIIGDLRAARSAAVLRGQSIQVRFNGSSLQYLVWTDTNRDNTEQTTEDVTKTLPSYAGMKMVCNPATGSFSSMGTWSSTNAFAQITFSLPGAGTNIVVITPSGEVDSDL